MQYKDKRGNTRRSSGRNFEVDDFEEQKVKIRELFDQYEKENSPLPSGLIGITYAQYRDYFENHMGVTFDNDVDFQDICEVLDPDNTQRIQYDQLIEKLTEPQSPDEPHDEAMDDLINDINLNQLEQPNIEILGAQKNIAYITVEKLTEIRRLFERHGEFIQDDEMLSLETEADNTQYKRIEDLIQSKNVVHDEKNDIRMADFELLFAEFLKNRKDPKDSSPLYITNIQFSQCISAYEMKIYLGEPVTSIITDSFRQQINVQAVDDIVLSQSIGNDTNRESDYGGTTSRETRRLIIDQLKQISKQNQGNNSEILLELMVDFTRNQRWKTYQEGQAYEEWDIFFTLLQQSIDVIHQTAKLQERDAQRKDDQVSDLKQQLNQGLLRDQNQRTLIEQLQKQSDKQYDENQKLSHRVLRMEKSQQEMWNLENKLNEKEDIILSQNNEIQKYRNKLEQLGKENEEYQFQIQNLQQDVDALSFALKDDKAFEEIESHMTKDKGDQILQRLKKLGVLIEPSKKLEGRKRLDTVTRNDVLVELDKKIKVKDKLSREDQEQYLQVIEQMVTTNIQEKEREALLAIRKEIKRKQMALDRAMKDMNKLNRHIDKKEKEIETIAKILIKKDELAKQYKRIIDKMQRENLQLLNRGTMLEAKLKYSQSGIESQQVGSFPVSRENSFLQADNNLSESQIQDAFAKASKKNMSNLQKIQSQVTEVVVQYEDDEETDQYIDHLKQAQAQLRGDESSFIDRVTEIQTKMVDEMTRKHTVTGLDIDESNFNLPEKNAYSSEISQGEFFGQLSMHEREKTMGNNLYKDPQSPVKLASTFGDLVALQNSERTKNNLKSGYSEDNGPSPMIQIGEKHLSKVKSFLSNTSASMAFEKRPDMSQYYSQDYDGQLVIDPTKYIDNPEPDTNEELNDETPDNKLQKMQKASQEYLAKVSEVIIEDDLEGAESTRLSQSAKQEITGSQVAQLNHVSIMDSTINVEQQNLDQQQQNLKQSQDHLKLEYQESFGRIPYDRNNQDQHYSFRGQNSVKESINDQQNENHLSIGKPEASQQDLASKVRPNQYYGSWIVLDKQQLVSEHVVDLQIESLKNQDKNSALGSQSQRSIKAQKTQLKNEPPKKSKIGKEAPTNTNKQSGLVPTIQVENLDKKMTHQEFVSREIESDSLTHNKVSYKSAQNPMQDIVIQGLFRDNSIAVPKLPSKAQDNLNQQNVKMTENYLPRTSEKIDEEDKNSLDLEMAFSDKNDDQEQNRKSSLFDQPGDNDVREAIKQQFKNQSENKLSDSQHEQKGSESSFMGNAIKRKLSKVVRKTKLAKGQLQMANVQMNSLEMAQLPQAQKKYTLMSHVTNQMNFDHLSLFDPGNKNHNYIIKILDGFKEKRTPAIAFSDEMHIYNRSSKKQSVFVIITDNLFLILTKRFALVKKYGLVELKSIVSITSNSSILSLKFRNARKNTVAENIKSVDDKTNKDIILETYRRSEFIVFLLNSASIHKRQRPNLLTANQFRIDNTHIIDFEIGDEDSKTSTNNQSVLKQNQPKATKQLVSQIDSRDYLMAYKAGYLLKSSHSFLRQGKWDKRFYVLCTIGLIYMKEPSQKEVKLFPFQDFKIIELSESKLKKAYVFQVKTLKGGLNDVVLQANSKKDYDEWLKAFAKFQTKLQAAKDQLMEQNAKK